MGASAPLEQRHLLGFLADTAQCERCGTPMIERRSGRARLTLQGYLDDQYLTFAGCGADGWMTEDGLTWFGGAPKE
jgi:hypothetical protein